MIATVRVNPLIDVDGYATLAGERRLSGSHVITTNQPAQSDVTTCRVSDGYASSQCAVKLKFH